MGSAPGRVHEHLSVRPGHGGQDAQIDAALAELADPASPLIELRLDIADLDRRIALATLCLRRGLRIANPFVDWRESVLVIRPAAPARTRRFPWRLRPR
jgi:hypothetical protein